MLKKSLLNVLLALLPAAISFSLPVMVFLLLVQRYIVSGMMVEAVKE
ncbi:hypothetical protein [Bacillus taeanensis]|nr:hypothetical protein [Bacillus taeanensis]